MMGASTVALDWAEEDEYFHLGAPWRDAARHMPQTVDWSCRRATSNELMLMMN